MTILKLVIMMMIMIMIMIMMLIVRMMIVIMLTAHSIGQAFERAEEERKRKEAEDLASQELRAEVRILFIRVIQGWSVRKANHASQYQRFAPNCHFQ